MKFNIWKNQSPRLLATVMAIFLVSPSYVQANPLVGDWLCIQQQQNEGATGQMSGTFSFQSDGYLKADMNIDLTMENIVVDANAIYLSKWQLDGNLLGETPIRVWIKAYNINGNFARNSVSAQELKWSLMSDSDIPSTVSFANNNDEVTLDRDGSMISCFRR